MLGERAEIGLAGLEDIIGTAGDIDEIQSEAEIGVVEHVAPAAVEEGGGVLGSVGFDGSPGAEVVAGPVRVAEEDVGLEEIHEAAGIEAVGDGGVGVGVGEVVGPHELPQAGVIAAEVFVAVVVHGDVGGGGFAVQFHLHEFVFVEVVMAQDVIFVEAVAQVVEAPVFTVEENEDGAAELAVEAGVFGERLQKEVADDAVAPVIAAVAEDEGIEFGDGFVGEELVFEGAVAAGIDAQGLAGAGTGGVAVEADADGAVESERTVGFKEFDGARPFPGAAGLQHVVVDGGIDADVVVKEVGGIGGDGDDGKRIAVGSGGINDIRLGDGGAGESAFLEGAGAQDVELEDFAVGRLPAFVIIGAGRFEIGRDFGKVVGYAGLAAEGDGVGENRRGFGGFGAIEGVADDGAGLRGGERHLDVGGEESAGNGIHGRLQDGGIPGGGIGGAGGMVGEVLPRAGAVGLPAVGEVGGDGDGLEPVHQGSVRLRQEQFFAAGADGEVRVELVAVGDGRAVFARSPDNEEFVGLDGDGAERPLERRGVTVGESPSVEIHGDGAVIPDFEPVRVVAVLVLFAGIVGGQDFINNKPGGRGVAGDGVGIAGAGVIVPAQGLEFGVGVGGGRNGGGQRVKRTGPAGVFGRMRDLSGPVGAAAGGFGKRRGDPVMEGIADKQAFAGTRRGRGGEGHDGVALGHGGIDGSDLDGRVFGFLHDHPALDAVGHVVHRERVQAAGHGLDFGVFAAPVGGTDFAEGKESVAGPFVRPAFGSDFEIVVVGGDSLDGDAPGAAGERHGFVGPVVPPPVVTAGILGRGAGGEEGQREQAGGKYAHG